jgi:hypothetical protein
LLTAHQAAKVVDDNAVLQLSAYLEVSGPTHMVHSETAVVGGIIDCH